MCASVYGRLWSISNWPNPVAVDTLAWPSAMHRSWKPPNEPHLHLKGAPITLAAFYFIDVAREPRGCAPSTSLRPPSLSLSNHHPIARYFIRAAIPRHFHQLALIPFCFRFSLPFFFSLSLSLFPFGEKISLVAPCFLFWQRIFFSSRKDKFVVRLLHSSLSGLVLFGLLETLEKRNSFHLGSSISLHFFSTVFFSLSGERVVELFR